jgi:hypothetical protein
VVNLDVRKKIANLPLPGMPHLGSGITWEWKAPQPGGRQAAHGDGEHQPQGRRGHRDRHEDLEVVKTIPPAAPASSCAATRTRPTPGRLDDVAQGQGHLQVIDKRTLERVADIRTDPGKTLAHVEFTRDGKYVLASLWERKADGGAIIVFDAATFKEVKRIPMDKPVGKYNLHNKITRSEGTSH